MLRRTLLCAAVLVLASSCAEAPFEGETTVEEVIQNIHAWDGKIYIVRGWLGRCEGLDCGLYANKADALLVPRGFDDPAWSAAYDRSLRVGSIGNFDAEAEPLQFQEVKITALVEDYCRGWSVGCTDRVFDLIPFSIEPVSDQAEEN